MTAPLRLPADDGFRTKLRVSRYAANAWDLEADLVYEGSRETFTAEAGFRTDFASVPALVQSLIPRTGPWDKAAVIHDVFCTDLRRHYDELQVLAAHGIAAAAAREVVAPPMVNAIDADGLFRQMMRRAQVGPVRRWLMWTGVRWGALRNPARRHRWWVTAPAVLAISAAVLACALAVLAAWGLVAAEVLRLL